MSIYQINTYTKDLKILWKLCKKWRTETSSRPIFVSWKSFIWSKSKWSAAYFNYILIALSLAYNKNELYRTLDSWSRDVPNFDFLEKGLGIASPPHFVYDFSRKSSLILYSINWPKIVVWLLLFLVIISKLYKLIQLYNCKLQLFISQVLTLLILN